MEKNSKENLNKKFKILAIFLIFLCLIVATCFCGFLIHINKMSVCKVQYYSDADNVLIQTYSKGEKVKLPETPVKNGYKFLGWTLDKDSKVWATDEMVINSEISLYAQWQKNSYQLYYDNENYKIDFDCNFLVENNSIIFADSNNNVVKIRQKDREGYDFVGWELTDGSYSSAIDIIDFNKFNCNKILLKEKYFARTATFSINENNNYSISNLSHKDNIVVGEILSFDVVLEESVSKSEINVLVSSGKINQLKKNNVYNVEVADFTEDFEVYIDNVDINEYSVTFYDESETLKKSIKYGETIKLPTFVKPGYDLIGFTDQNGILHSGDIKVTKDLMLEATYEIKEFSITFPKNTGKFVIKHENNSLLSNVITKKYMESLTFEVELSKAYNNSNIEVYSVTGGEKVLPAVNNGKYIFKNIDSDIIIYIDNITINTYSVIVDNNNYGKFTYGSFVSIVDSGIMITDESGVQTIIPMLYTNNFGGWILGNGELLTNSSIQELADGNVLIINGNYIKKNL